MKALTRSICIAVAAAATAALPAPSAGQDGSGLVVPARPAANLWFVSLGGGIGGHDNGPFARRLQSYTPRDRNGERMLYQASELSNVGSTLNASASVQISSALLLGLSGELLSFPTIHSIRAPGQPRDEYDLGGWGGGVDIGYFLVNEHRMMLYPFLHAGYYGYGLTYQNGQADSMRFFEGPLVAGGANATYTGSAPRLGVGLALVSDLTAEPGLFLVARLMYGTMLSRPSWETEGAPVTNGGLTPPYNALSLSIQIGIGGGAATGGYLE